MAAIIQLVDGERGQTGKVTLAEVAATSRQEKLCELPACQLTVTVTSNAFDPGNNLSSWGLALAR